MALSDFSLRRPVTILVATAALLVLGGVSVTRLKLDFLPRINLPFLGVWVPYPNAVPKQAEREIARPIEEVMATLGDLHELRSQSFEDGVWVGMEFALSRDVNILHVEVREKMEQIRPLLPDDVRDYFIFSFNSSDIPVMVGRISAKGRDLSSSYDLLERRVINPLRRVEGVGRVLVDGINPKDITIYLLLDRIIEHGVDVGRLFERLNNNNLDLTLGRVQHGRERISVRAMGQFRSLADIEDLQVNDAGLRLKDIAEVVYAEPAPGYYRRINGEPAIAFEIQKASGANIVDVSRRVRDVLAEIEKDPSLQGIDVVLFFDQADDIRESLRGLLQAGLIGSLLAVAVLLLFLRRLRSTLVAASAIPISVIATCVFLFLSNRSLNVITMMGLMLAVGMLVDNAIVVLESIYRRQEKGEDAGTASRLGAREVAMAVTASTLTSIIVYAPIILSKNDITAVWLGEVGVTISVTLIFSLLVCLSIVPLMATRTSVNGGLKEFRALTRLRERYLRVLRWTALRHPKRTGLIIVPLVLVATIVAMQSTGFGPEDFDERSVQLNSLYLWLEFTDNTNVYRVVEYVEEVEDFLLARRDSLGFESVYTFYRDNTAAFSLYFEASRNITPSEFLDLRQYLRGNMPVLAGAEYHFGFEDDTGSGATQISVTLFGEDTDLLEEIAGEAQRRMGLIDGVEDMRTNAESGRDEIRVVLDRQLAGRYGVSPYSLAQVMGLTFRGVPLRRFQARDREIDMGIVLEPSDRRNIENLSRLPVSYQDGRPVLLGQVARFEIAEGPQSIRRESQKTALTIYAAYEGEAEGELWPSITRIMNSLDLPPGYSWSYGRQLRQAQEEQQDMQINILLALVCVYLVMAALFESYLHPLVIMLCIPFAALGVIWLLMATSTPFNLFAMIGIVILTGIVVNNGIVLIDHVNNLRRRGLDRSTAIMEGCRDRFRPILMTAATTILGLTPLALGKAAVADGYYFPLARAVIGGLAASTILTLVVLPTFYVLAESAALRVRQTIAWGLGRGPLPWRLPPAAAPVPAEKPDP